MKWQDISVDINTLSPGGCLPLPWGYIHEQNHDLFIFFYIYNYIKADFKQIFLNLSQMTEVTRCSCWHQNIVPKGLSVLAIYMYKSDFKGIF